MAALSADVRGWQADQETFDAVVAELAGLNRTQWRCLDIMGTRGPLTAGQLAEASHLTTGAVTAVVDYLEAEGLVRRTRDSVDRRRVFIETTDEVARRASAVYGPLMKESEQVLRAFDAGQLEVITEFVRKERGLLTRHTARAHDLLDARRSTPAPARRRDRPSGHRIED